MKTPNEIIETYIEKNKAEIKPADRATILEISAKCLQYAMKPLKEIEADKSPYLTAHAKFHIAEQTRLSAEQRRYLAWLLDKAVWMVQNQRVSVRQREAI